MEPTTSLQNLTTATEFLMGMATTVLDFVIENPLLAICFAGGFLTIAIGLIGQLKHA